MTKEQKAYIKNLVYAYYHDLQKKGFEFFPLECVKFSKATTYLGRCTIYNNFSAKIDISEMAIVESELMLKSTILHELCHAMLNSYKHGLTWQQNAAKVSKLYNIPIAEKVKKTAAHKQFIISQCKYEMKCPKCKHRWRFLRKNKIIKNLLGEEHTMEYTCGFCGNKNLIVKTLDK